MNKQTEEKLLKRLRTRIHEGLNFIFTSPDLDFEKWQHLEAKKIKPQSYSQDRGY